MTPLEQLQQNLFDRLDNDPSLALVNVLQQKTGVTDNDIAQTLGAVKQVGTKKGACILIDETFFDVDHPASVAVTLATTTRIRCIEQPLVNRSPLGTNLSAEQLALDVLRLFHPYVMYDIKTTTTAHKGDPITYDDGLREMVITVRCEIKLPRTKACATPIITGTSETGVTITCATPGAAIYYTTDGTYPCPNNPTAAIFGAAQIGLEGGSALGLEGGGAIATENQTLTLAACTQVRAVAFNPPNLAASDLACATIQ